MRCTSTNRLYLPLYVHFCADLSSYGIGTVIWRIVLLHNSPWFESQSEISGRTVLPVSVCGFPPLPKNTHWGQLETLNCPEMWEWECSMYSKYIVLLQNCLTTLYYLLYLILLLRLQQTSTGNSRPDKYPKSQDGVLCSDVISSIGI